MVRYARVVLAYNCFNEVGCILSLQSDSSNQIYHLSEMVARLLRFLHNVLLSSTLCSPPGLCYYYLNCGVETGGMFLMFLQLVGRR